MTKSKSNYFVKIEPPPKNKK